MAAWKNLDTLASYGELSKLKNHVDIAKAMSGENGAERVAKYSVPMAAGLCYNYAAKEVDETVLAALEKLANEAELSEKFEELYNGAVINTGENRMVLHHLARVQLGKAVVADGVDKREFYVAQQKKAADFANKVHAGEITNENGEKFTTVVQIGIGGSDLGPRALYIALENWAKANNTFKMEAKFISNVDPDDAAAVLASVDLAHSLFIVVSKSGTTLETLTNEAFVKDALVKAGLNPSKHMLAVTSETSPLAKSDSYLTAIFMDDYIGGRYSSVSGVGGAILSLAFGPEVFAQLLDGAAEEDKLAANKNIFQNPDMLDALIGIYERNVQGYPATAVLPYSQALSRFPAHLQQCDMESNGKTVNRFGEPVDYPTGPVIFGEPGTNGQHSFYQLLHQGSDIVPLQFIGFRNSQLGVDVDIENSTSQQKLCANVAAQIVAFACGKKDDNLNKNFKGHRPSSIITGDELTPASLGALLAHFENKIMFQGFVWNLNSFDQEGVQLGKVLAKRVLAHETDGALKAYGFCSTVAAMTWYGFKKTLPAVAPEIVLADTEIIKNAPMELVRSGVGDIMAKYTALADWKMAHVLTNELFCEKIYSIMQDAADTVMQSVPGIARGEESAYADVTYALIMSGIAMQMMGNSRPASGAEHHTLEKLKH